MSLSFKHLYEFGEFRLDPKEKILTRAGEPVELAPKGFQLLSVFVENHGRLLEKDELMEKVWADSFVEESNLTFNIRQLRVILGDDARQPKYIKTVRRHGYRFIADVRQISEEDEPAPIQAADLSQSPEAARAQRTGAPERKAFSIPILFICMSLLIAAAAAGVWYVRNRTPESKAPVLFAPFAAEKLSNNGKVFRAALSPDGKNMVYVNGKGADKQSVWLRQLENGNNVEIIPPSDDIYSGLAFAPDGKTFYFSRRPRQAAETAGIYRVSIFGGIPQHIIGDTEGRISLSPNGALISFVRCPRRGEENCALWIADAADGQNERRLVERRAPVRIGDSRFSADGRRVAFAVGQIENGKDEFGLSEVDLETGAERELTGEKFSLIGQLAPLPDNGGWLLTGSRGTNIISYIWHVSASGGELVRLTGDAESYGTLSLDKEATKIVSTQVKWEFHVRLLTLENPLAARLLTDGYSAAFAPDGRIYFSSNMSGSAEIWSIDADGGNRRQLTNNKAAVGEPVVSPDNGSVFFVSNHTGATHVWRMKPDGSDQTQLTREAGGFPLSVSPDGEWVYYRHGVDRTLWRVSVKTGEERLVLNKAKDYFAVSPDGSQVAYSEEQGDERLLTITALADGQAVRTFQLADRKNLLLQIAWTPDGKNLAYVSAAREKDNNVLWLQPLAAAAAARRIADLGDEVTNGLGLPITPDGKIFAIVQGEWLRDAVLLKGLH